MCVRLCVLSDSGLVAVILSFLLLACADSPVHIVGVSLPHSSQPSKVTSLLPKRLEGGELVLQKLNSLQSIRRDAAAQPPSTSNTGKADEWRRLKRLIERNLTMDSSSTTGR